MKSLARMMLGVAIVAVGAIAAFAQGNTGPDMKSVTINDPLGPDPDPGHIPFTPPDKVVWKGDPAVSQTARISGDPAKPGLYGQLLKWYPGSGTRPHMHDQDRYIYVISGTWWVGTSSHYDPKLSHPMPAGSVIKDVANTVHWDGVRMGGPPAVIELVGMGPVKTIQVDDNGNPLPPRQPAAAGR